MKVRSIEVGKRIAEAPKFRIYLGQEEDHQVILKVAKTFEDNDTLAEEAGRFNILHVFETQLADIQQQQGLDNPHYDWLFANLCSSFMEPSQGDRRINVFDIPDISLNEITPLAKLRNETEIDTRSSVWIFGRFLKFYAMFELLAASEDTNIVKYPLFSPDDYLIAPEKHRLVYYNFSGDMDDITASEFVKSVARFILGWVVTEDDINDQKYIALLKDFSENGRSTFDRAHKDLYDLVKELWGIQYYPFTYRARNTNIWKTIKE